MNIWEHIGIIIRSAREHILTLDAHPLPRRSKCIIVASPQQYAHHRDVYTAKNVKVVRNPGTALASSAYMCYVAAQRARWSYFFRMDDEVPASFFVGMKTVGLELEYVIRHFYDTLRRTETTLVGPASTSRRDWLKPRQIRSWAGISGAAILIQTPYSARAMIDPSLRHFDDIYESCSHRHLAGAVGRCGYIGGNKMATTGPAQTTVAMLNKTQGHAVQRILQHWSPDYITADGWSFYRHNTEDDFWVTVNWKFRRHVSFVAGGWTVPQRTLL